ncbi:GATA zinc finger domain-containing protein 10-like [Calliphora vicina]|uniref:GATA zinc finger domain-containing protein 10-like n=1 Tax=Calliphora vicina TaxID=7373 RepID=UPI00325B28A6
MSVEKRREVVGNLGYCFNCLARSHNLNSCTSMGACKRCDQLHHTMLHPPRRQQRQRRGPSQDRRTSSPQRPRSPRRPHIQHQRQHQNQRQHQHQSHRQHQQHQRHQQQQQHRQQQEIQLPTAQPSNLQQPKPTAHLLAEAIKSLADVLCVTSKQ